LQKAFSGAQQFNADKHAYYQVLNRYIQSRSFEQLEVASLWLTGFNPKDGIAWDYLGISRLEQGNIPKPTKRFNTPWRYCRTILMCWRILVTR
jgi:hypothetical protein